MLWKTCSIIFLCLWLGGCQEQIRFGVEQTVLTIPDILTDNMVNNLLSVHQDRYAPIAQVSLKESVSTANNTFNYSIFPGIAFRAIAITGAGASAGNSLSENWSADPTNGSLDYYRLQILLGYAINGDRKQPFGPIEDMIFNAGKPQKEQQLREAFSFLAPLPDGPFATVDGHCVGRDMAFLGTLSTHWVCFHAEDGMSGQEVAHLLVLWTIAIPQMSIAINQPGASTTGSSSLAITASQH